MRRGWLWAGVLAAGLAVGWLAPPWRARGQGERAAPATAAVAGQSDGATSASASRPAKDVRFYFAQITDTHLATRRPLHTERTARAIAMINDLPVKVACVLHTGDLFDDSVEDPAARKIATDLFAKLEMPIHYLAGNHDILGRVGRTKPTAAAWRKAYGPLCRKVEVHGVVFLIVYTEAFSKGFDVEGTDSLAWLKAQLRATAGRPVIVVHHTPSVLDFYGGQFHRGWPDDLRDQWVRLLNAYDVKAVIAGHFHRAEQHWLGRVPLYVAAPVARFWGRQGSWRLYEYDHGRLSYRTVYIQD